MIISQAKITMGDGSHPGDTIGSAIVIDNDYDQVTNCLISGGEVVARKDVLFLACVIMGKLPAILGECPLGSASMIQSCRFIKTKLPDAYYTGCYFTEE